MYELTEDQINEISKTIDETAPDSMKEAKELAANSEEKKDTPYNNNSANMKDIISKDKLSNEYIKDNFESEAAEQIINKVISEVIPTVDKLSDEDIHTFKDALRKYCLDVDRRGQTKSFSYYNAMPEVIKNGIVASAGANSLNTVGNFEKEAKNFMAGSIMEAVRKAVNETTKYVDLNTVNFDNLFDDNDDEDEVDLDSVTPSDLDIFKLNTEYFETRLNAMIEDCEQHGETEAAERGKAIKASYVEASELTDLIETYKSGKLKIKKILLEKYERTFREFNIYYESTINVITDIHKAYEALLRTFPDYNKDAIIKAMVVFTQYVKYKHFDPDNIIDHTFMFYFIQNCIISCAKVENDVVAKFKANMKTLLDLM